MARDVALGNPAEHPAEDAFNRMAFCNALADRIAALDDSDSAAVIGLYGKWGYGKSTVLNFIRHRLETTYPASIAVVAFNPWLFTSQDDLLVSFLGFVKKLQEADKKNVRELVLNAMQFSGAAGMIPLVGAGLTKLVDQIKKAADKTLEAQQAELVARARARPMIVVMIDDLDRLDRNEVMLMLKMVRLNSNIPRLVYVMAFDDEIIGAVAGSAYGLNAGAGREFLEKIVQFPFSIPAIGHARLVDYVMQHARAACAHAAIAFDEALWKEFEQIASRHFSLRLTTPRQAIRYGAAVDFALPMLKGEVDPVHQMVVEGIRILFPDLYAFMRDNLELLADSYYSEAMIDRLKPVTGPADSPGGMAALALVEYLLKPERNRASIRRRFGNSRYFGRYFEYSVRPTDILEGEIDQLIAMLKKGEKKEEKRAVELLRKLMLRNAPDVPVLLREAVANGSDTDRIRIAGCLMMATATDMPAPFNSTPGAIAAAALTAELVLYPWHGGDRSNAEMTIWRERQTEELTTLLSFEAHPAMLPLVADAVMSMNAKLAEFEQRLDEPKLAAIRAVVLERMKSEADANMHQLFAPGSDGFALFEWWRQHDQTSFVSWFSPRVEQDPDVANGLLDFFDRHSIDVVMEMHPYLVSNWIEPLVLLHAARKHHGIPDGPVNDSPHRELLHIYKADPHRFTRRATPP